MFVYLSIILLLSNFPWNCFFILKNLFFILLPQFPLFVFLYFLFLNYLVYDKVYLTIKKFFSYCFYLSILLFICSFCICFLFYNIEIFIAVVYFIKFYLYIIYISYEFVFFKAAVGKTIAKETCANFGIFVVFQIFVFVGI